MTDWVHELLDEGLGLFLRESPNPVRNDVCAYLESHDLKHVSISQENVFKTIKVLADEELKAPTFAWSTHRPGSLPVVDYLVFANSLNWCFWHPGHAPGGVPRPYRNLDEEGATAMFRSLSECAKGPGPQSAKGPGPQSDLLCASSPLSIQFVYDVFGDIPHPRWRLALLDAVRSLVDSHGGSFQALFSTFRETFGDDGLLTWLAGVPAYHDTTAGVRFLKRAQLLAYMLVCRPDVPYVGVSIADLTVFADYRVPSALRCLGLTGYAPDLQDLVSGGHLVSRGSLMELEVRLSTVLVGDIIVYLLGEVGVDVAAPLIDTYFFRLGRLMKRHQPIHLTVTTAY